MSKDITTSGLSRRQIAKGAAWAVPAVSVAAAAPSLAASPTVCPAGSLVVNVVDCRALGLLSTPYFTITNPSATCTVPEGSPVTLAGTGLAQVVLDGLVALSADVVFDGSSTGELAADLGPGQTIRVDLFSGLAVVVLGSYSLTILDSTGSFDLNAGVGGLVTVCDVL